jgi:23S rRNA (uracil1939-C5)-methyltransferase
MSTPRAFASVQIPSILRKVSLEANHMVKFMGAIKKKRLIDIDIVEFSKKGNGLGIFKNQEGNLQNVEVPFTIPGDKVRCLLLTKRRGIYASLLEEVITPSPERILPKCIHFGVCGGCRWQQIPYEKQLQQKESLIRHYFAPFLTHLVDVKPIVPCAPPWIYRNKMEFSFTSNAAKSHFLGLYMDSSRGKVFNLNECHLVNPWFSEGVKAVRQWWLESGLDAYHPTRNTGSLRNLTLREGRRSGDRLVMLTVSGNPDFALKKHHLETFVAFIRASLEPLNSQVNLSIFVRIQQIAKGMQTNFYEIHLHGPEHIREILNIQIDPQEPEIQLDFKISPTAFFQPNTIQAEKLYSLALAYAEISKESVVYDLYCGTGTLGICAAKKAKRVIGIEIAPESTLDAQANAAANGINNIEFLTGPVSDVLKQIWEEQKYPLPDLVVIDPPRAGLDPETIKHILQLKPMKILYISCNPMTQAENLKELIPAGYQLKTLQPVDQFPQTPHVETIILLKRCS